MESHPLFMLEECKVTVAFLGHEGIRAIMSDHDDAGGSISVDKVRGGFFSCLEVWILNVSLKFKDIERKLERDKFGHSGPDVLVVDDVSGRCFCYEYISVLFLAEL